MALLGYARVSTQQQSLDSQVAALSELGVRSDRIFTDKASGQDKDRPGLKALLARAEMGDRLLVKKLDRLGRNTLDMIQIVEFLHDRGVGIQFVDDNLSTEGEVGYMIMTILAAVAQAERARILERTNEGRRAALERGVRFGRKPHRNTARAMELIAGGAEMGETIRECEISRSTYYRLVQKHRASANTPGISAAEV